MRLFNLLPKFGRKELPQESYLSLVLSPDRILTCVWSFDQNENVISLGFAQKDFTNIDNLIHQAAAAIDQAAQKAESDVSKVVFGLSFDWLEDVGLSQDASKILKQLSEDLELEAQAFIPLASAINHLIKIEESVTPYAVLIGLFAKFSEVHLIANNRVVRTKTTESETGASEVAKLISQLKTPEGNLPSRIIVYGVDEDSEIGQQLAKYDWGSLFLHQPKISFLKEQDLVKSVAHAQAADILGHEPSLISTAPPEETAAEPKEKMSAAAVKEDKTYDMGFVEGEDILLTQKEAKPIESKPTSPVSSIKGPKEDYALEVEEAIGEPKSQDLTRPHFATRITNFFLNLFPPKKLLVIFLILLAILGIGAFVASRTLFSAEVTIKVDAQNQEANFKANVVGNSPFDPAKSQILGTLVSSTATGSQKAVATGSKKLGEKARGEVTVLNWTTSSKIFTSQTVIITKNGLKFTLDSEVEVASRSASTPGQAKVAVRAIDLGPNGNITAGNDFTFQEFDELLYSARNDSSLSGGDERQATVVSSEDLAKLEKSLSESLTQKAKEELRAKISTSKLHDEAIAIKVLKKEFDKKADEEASLVNLNMEIKAQSLIYNQEDLQKLLTSQIDAPQNFEARPQDIEIFDLVVRRRDATLALSGRFNAKLVPPINIEELKDKIAGKNIKEARSLIKEIAPVSDVLVKFTPNLPITSTLPPNKAKIQIKIEAS